MSPTSLQASGPAAILRRLVAIGAVAVALGGCLGRGADVATTGSVGEASGPSRSAIETLGQAYDRAPDNPATAMAYARGLKGIGQHAQAVAVLQQAAIKNSRDQELLAAYGKALAEAGRLKEASSVLARAHTPERPDWRILSAQGAVSDQLGDHDGAQRLYEAALRLAPGEPSVLSNQGLSFALARKLPQAEAILRQAAASPGADGRVRQNLALVIHLRGRAAGAESAPRRDLAADDAARNQPALREIAAQPNTWAALRKADATGIAAPVRSATGPKLAPLD